MHSKTYRAVKTKAPTETVDLASAVAFLKEHARATFDETVEVHVHLNVTKDKTDQVVRGQVTLPHGSPKEKKIVVLTEELIEQIAQTGTIDADLTVATPALMPTVAKVAKILGPKGLMPNPKTGTVTTEPEKVIQELRAGKVSFKKDTLGNIHEAVAKLSWPAAKIMENIQALLAAISSCRPPGVRGQFIQTITIKSTMSPGVKISPQ